MYNNPLNEILIPMLNQLFWYVLIILWILLLITWVLYHFGILDKFINFDNYLKPKPIPKKVNPFDLVYQWKVFTSTELKFFHELNKIIDNEEYFLFTKIRLVDLVKIKKAEYTKYMTMFNKLSKKHIDFIIVDKFGNIKLLIELDDKYHNNYKAKINDKFKNELCEYLDIPLIRYYAWKEYDMSRTMKFLV